MHRVLLVVAVLGLLACGASAKGPAWPKQSVKDVDGGESIAPRSSVAAVEDSDDEVVEAPAKLPDKPDDKPVKETPKPETPAAKPAATTPDEPIQTEEIVIEVED